MFTEGAIEMTPAYRIYSVPYNGTEPEWFLQEVKKRKQHIDHVYCELPFQEMISHVRFTFDDRKAAGEPPANVDSMRAQYLKNCFEFLRLSRGQVRRICPVNAMSYQFDSEDAVKSFVLTLARAANELQIEGFILSDYRVAALLHAVMPELEIHTSCNAYQWNLRQMEIWRKKCGVNVFNPPREILRSPSKLKEMHAAGFRLKCLVNEACLMGCPNSFNHNLAIARGQRPILLSCCQDGIADLFRANWILPRWQKYYDDVVDIYKIAGRNSAGDYPFRTLDAYLAENDTLPLAELMLSGTILFAAQVLPAEILQKITVDQVPDKLLTCECKECSTCGLCEKILAELIPKQYQDTFRFKIKVQ